LFCTATMDELAMARGRRQPVSNYSREAIYGVSRSRRPTVVALAPDGQRRHGPPHVARTTIARPAIQWVGAGGQPAHATPGGFDRAVLVRGYPGSPPGSSHPVGFASG